MSNRFRCHVDIITPYSFFDLSIYDYFQIHVYINDVYNSENKFTMDSLLRVPSICNDNIHYIATTNTMTFYCLDTMYHHCHAYIVVMCFP